MKRMIVLILLLLLVTPAMAEEQEQEQVVEDSSATYTIDLGDGQGAILVFGDNNSVYLPDTSEPEIIPNEITISENRINLVLTDTDLIVDGTKTRYSKLVFVLEGDTWELVWYEQ